jgi:hypothetical protein
MKSTEVKYIKHSHIILFIFHLQPNVANGGVNKPPPYPVEGASMIIDPPAPDPHTADLVTYVLNSFKK